MAKENSDCGKQQLALTGGSRLSPSGKLAIASEVATRLRRARRSVPRQRSALRRRRITPASPLL